MEKLNLMPHQIKALQETEGMNRAAYYLDMGLGKTFVGSEKADSFPNKILVICQKSKITDWTGHFQKYYPLTVFDLTDKKQLEEYVSVVGKCVGVINYDLVYRRPELEQLKAFTLMLDESSMIQNEKARRSKFILRMKPENVILLSGTPTGGKYENLWSQVRLLGWNIDKARYWEHYIDVEYTEISGFSIPVIKGYKNVERLKAKLKEHGAVFMKSEEAFELPEQKEIFIKVKAPEEYRTFMKDSIVTVEVLNGDGKTKLVGDTPLTKRLYARTLCGMYCREKVQAFKDLLLSTDDRLVVFYNFNGELKILSEVAGYCKKHVSYVNGCRKDLKNYDMYKDTVTFCQYQAGAMGLNLQLANKVIYFSLPERSELFEQSKKRIHRIGQEKTCFYYYLMCSGSVENHILETLKMRKDYTDALFENFEKSGCQHVDVS